MPICFCSGCSMWTKKENIQSSNVLFIIILRIFFGIGNVIIITHRKTLWVLEGCYIEHSSYVIGIMLDLPQYSLFPSIGDRSMNAPASEHPFSLQTQAVSKAGIFVHKPAIDPCLQRWLLEQTDAVCVLLYCSVMQTSHCCGSVFLSAPGGT